MEETANDPPQAAAAIDTASSGEASGAGPTNRALPQPDKGASREDVRFMNQLKRTPVHAVGQYRESGTYIPTV